MEGWKDGRKGRHLRRPLRWHTPAPQCGTGVPARQKSSPDIEQLPYKKTRGPNTSVEPVLRKC